MARETFLERLVGNLYERNDIALERGKFRARGEVVDVFPAYMESAIRVEFWGGVIESIRPLDPLTGDTGAPLERFSLYPANQYITPRDKLTAALAGIRAELEERVTFFEKQNRLVEAQRIRMRTEYDLEMLSEMGFCSGIENYSRHIAGRAPGSRPWCLIDFFPKDFLLFIDESHVTVPQVGGMFAGDRSRKLRLVDFGFRLPSALDNRPLNAEEFLQVTGQTVYVSATPSQYELKNSAVVAEQLIRPTGLIDPPMEVRPIRGQVENLAGEIHAAVEKHERVLVTTLTKRMAEDLATYLRDAKVRVEYLHSDIDALERVEILRRLRAGEFDVLVGVNLLREGLDLPEVALVAILDADKEGFLRSETSLIQTSGRAARHEQGRVLLYADTITDSLRRAMEISRYRREKQLAYNKEHGITPRGTKRSVQSSLHIYGDSEPDPVSVAEAHGDREVAEVFAELEEEMLEAAGKLEFERAAILRDQIEALKSGGAGKLKRQKPGHRYPRFSSKSATPKSKSAKTDRRK